MCVIAYAQSTRPTDEQVEKFYEANSSGAGIAWREVNTKTKETWVRWIKGLDLEDIQKLVREVPFPFVSHYRIPSVGGPSLYLNHPFEINPECALKLEGFTPDPVLFHNGTFSKYRDYLLSTALGGPNRRVPGGKWSDSRAMAWVAAHLGVGILEIFDERIIAFGPDDIDLYGTWSPVAPGLWTSNMGWVNSFKGGMMTNWRGDDKVVRNIFDKPDADDKVSKGDSEVSPDKDPFPGGPTPIHGEEAREESPKEGETTPRPETPQAQTAESQGALKALGEAFMWARGKNPKPFKRPSDAAGHGTAIFTSTEEADEFMRQQRKEDIH